MKDQKQKTRIWPLLPLVVFALLALNQLKSWTQEIRPSINLTTVQKPYRLQSGKSVVLSPEE